MTSAEAVSREDVRGRTEARAKRANRVTIAPLEQRATRAAREPLPKKRTRMQIAPMAWTAHKEPRL